MNVETVQLGKYNATLRVLNPELPLNKENGHPAVIIIPGGSYVYVSKREGEVVGFDFLKHGYKVFILNYSTLGTNLEYETGTFSKETAYKALYTVGDEPVGSEFPNPLIELSEAMHYIRSNSNALNIDANKIGVVGFSAGGHLAASLSVHWHRDWLLKQTGYKKMDIRPNFQVLSYPILDYKLNEKIFKERNQNIDEDFIKKIERITFGTSMNEDLLSKATVHEYVSAHTPPTFMWHTVQDEVVHVKNVLQFAQALDDVHVPWELHAFTNGPHGLSTATKETGIETRANSWMSTMFSWLDEILKEK